jgi:hypothetical protein
MSLAVPRSDPRPAENHIENLSDNGKRKGRKMKGSRKSKKKKKKAHLVRPIIDGTAAAGQSSRLQIVATSQSKVPLGISVRYGVPGMRYLLSRASAELQQSDLAHTGRAICRRLVLHSHRPSPSISAHPAPRPRDGPAQRQSPHLLTRERRTGGRPAFDSSLRPGGMVMGASSAAPRETLRSFSQALASSTAKPARRPNYGKY